MEETLAPQEIQPAPKKRRLWLRILIIALAAILAIVAALGITFVAVWNDEISTVSSFTKLRDRNDENKEGAVYRMDVKGGFYFDAFLKNGGAKSDKELINFITGNITKGLIDMTISESDIACSSFTASTKDGKRLFGRNYDFDKTNVCITLCNPGGGRYKSFSTVDLNYVGMDIDKDVEGLMNKITCLAAPFAPLDGINEKGVSCGIYMSYQGNLEEANAVATNQNDPAKKDITSTTMLRMVLDYADSVDKAVELIQSYNLHDSANTSFHYMIADATGKSAILEWVPENGTDATDNDGAARKLNVIYNTDPRYNEIRGNAEVQYQWITNFIISDGYYDGVDESEMAGLDRYNHIQSRLQATDGVVENEKAAMQILKEVGRRTWNGGGGVTVHSVVYNLTDKTALWVANENFGDKTATYSYSLETGELKQVG